VLKNPMPYIKQANMTTGPQQVNNTMPVHHRIVAYSRAREILKVSQTNYWRQIMVNGWTLERRRRQAELIRCWRPWEQSTGPRSPEGKERFLAMPGGAATGRNCGSCPRWSTSMFGHRVNWSLNAGN
jgi:hypothetical protein